MEETGSLKREMSALEAQIPSEETVRRQEAVIKEELGAAWKHKLAAFSDENENLNDLVMFLQQVRSSETVSLYIYFSRLRLLIKIISVFFRVNLTL